MGLTGSASHSCVDDVKKQSILPLCANTAQNLSGDGEAAAIVCVAPLGMNRAVLSTLTFPSTSFEFVNACVRLRLCLLTSRKAVTQEKLLQALSATQDHRKHAAKLYLAVLMCSTTSLTKNYNCLILKSESNCRIQIPRVMALATFSHGCTLTFA